jgi:CRISP-associated protein Cas1
MTKKNDSEGKEESLQCQAAERYGCGIRMKGNRIVLKDGTDPFTGKQETEEWFVTQVPYERIVVAGKGYVSTEAISVLAEYNISIVLTDTYGNLITAMHKVMSSPTATNYRIAQYDAFRNPEKSRIPAKTNFER